jgi:hypothetical protein
MALAHDTAGGERAHSYRTTVGHARNSWHVLLDDDNPVSRGVAMAMLVNPGCHVGVLADGLMGSESLIEAVEAELGAVRSALGSSRPMS